jgi:hypothetical protein
MQTTSSIQTMLFNPKIANFHCSFITVGSDHDQHVCTMRDMAAGKPHLYHLNAENADAIGGCFRKVVVKFDQIVTKEVTVSVATTETTKRVPKSSTHMLTQSHASFPRSSSAPRHGHSRTSSSMRATSELPLSDGFRQPSAINSHKLVSSPLGGHAYMQQQQQGASRYGAAATPYAVTVPQLQQQQYGVASTNLTNQERSRSKSALRHAQSSSRSDNDMKGSNDKCTIS